MHASMGRARFLVRTLALCLFAAVAVQGLGGCTNPAGKVPVDSPVYAFQPADPDDYADDTDEAEDSDGGGDASDDSE